jgi:FtsH-binding integral membrane protein
MLYLGGILSSGLTLLFWLGLANLFVRIELLANVSLYLGLMVFSGFVMFDTQLLVEKFRLGNEDYLAHSLELFLGTSSPFYDAHGDVGAMLTPVREW